MTMKPSLNKPLISTLALTVLFNLVGSPKEAEAASIQLVGLTDSNTLISFDPNNPNEARSVGITGIMGNLIFVDTRPGNGMIYGLTDTNNVYTIDPNSGVAQLESTLNIPFEAGFTSGGDFNPNPDRLRLVGSNEQNFRVNVDTGEVTVDTDLDYASGDPNSGQDPNITAAAYTNSFRPSPDPTRRTTLYGIDSSLDILVTQGSINFLADDPSTPVSPNTGQLLTIGSLGIDFGSTGGLDIFSVDGTNTAFAASDSLLYTIDLATGAATTVGTIGEGNASIIGLTARSVPEPSSVSTVLGLTALTFMGCLYRSKP